MRPDHFPQATANSIANHCLADLLGDCETKTLTFCSIPSDEKEELVTIEATSSPLHP
tara:strand:+ start:416 stop:586 length:171 start_codon:yes stop_codon:yes gene_type:complete